MWKRLKGFFCSFLSFFIQCKRGQKDFLKYLHILIRLSAQIRSIDTYSFDVSVNGERRGMQIRSISTYSFDVSANGDRRVIPSRRFPPKKRLLGNEWVSISSSFVICLLGWVNQERFFPLSKSCLNFFIVKKIESFAHLKMFSWIVAMCILTCVVGQDEEYSDGVGCIVHHPPHNDEFSCASLCDPTLIQAEIVKAVFLSGYYANFDCVKNKTSLKVCWNFFENMKKIIDKNFLR